MIFHNIQIEKLVTGAFGLGRMPDGLVVLVPHVLPDETVRVTPVRKRKSYLQARLDQVLEASPARIDPPCPLYGQCGGCALQHVRCEDQPRLKSAILHDQILRAGLFDGEKIASILSEPLASPLPFSYRQRIRLRINDRGECGFLRFHSHEIIPVNRCLLARPLINDVLVELRKLSNCRHLLGLSSELELLFNPDRQNIFLIFHFSRKPRPGDIKAARETAASLSHTGAVLLSVAGQGTFPFYSEDGEKYPQLALLFNLEKGRVIRLGFEPGSFCQVNLEQNEQLLKLLLDWAEVRNRDQVLDLFCGMGNFSLPLAMKAGHVLGMDLQRSAIRSARRNAEEAEIDNCRFERLAAVEGARKLAESGKRFDLVLLDPPRQGCLDSLPHVMRLGAHKIIYISCDPATLCRDLALLRQNGYRIRKMKMVDMFPQTHHLETIVLLEK
ncbi:MAG: 23S rRNA (uracil(1939)-C(5))-methyltransferase RlmD [Thermodesulfobacteriota bacterium]|nr:23S rRNA (uracil(1939)-C(5))-methyltransferase RlmD [Thermodesulfobacteriota bacterium]